MTKGMIIIFGILLIGIVVVRILMPYRKKGPRRGRYFERKYGDHWKRN